MSTDNGGETNEEMTAMGLMLLEALGALALLLFMVWWTMFSGRKKGERRDDDDTPQAPPT